MSCQPERGSEREGGGEEGEGGREQEKPCQEEAVLTCALSRVSLLHNHDNNNNEQLITNNTIITTSHVATQSAPSGTARRRTARTRSGSVDRSHTNASDGPRAGTRAAPEDIFIL